MEAWLLARCTDRHGGIVSFDTVRDRIEELDLFASSWHSSGNNIFRCPVHDDSKASANLSEGDDDRAVIFCHAGCSTEDIVEALGLKMSDLFGDPKVVAEYVYEDEAGKPVMRVLRWEPKSFTQERAGALPGTWKPTLEGLTVRPLYHLPAVLTSSHVWLVEGEKDADRLWSIGEIATTGASGAAVWRPEWTAALTGRDVTMIPDADEAGLRRVETVRAELEGKARSFRVRYVAAGKDISDHLDAGLGLDDLLDAPKRELRLKAIDLSDIPPHRTLLYEPFIYDRALTWLFGPSGHGKSIVLDKVMADLSRQGIVSQLWEWEEGYQEGERLARLGADLKLIDVFNMATEEEPVDLGTPWLADEMVGHALERHARLIVINPFILAGGVGDASDPDSWNAPIRRARSTFKRLIEETGAAVVVIDHQDDPHVERAHGGRSKKWLSDLYLRVTRDGDEYTPGKPYYLKIENLKQSREWIPRVNVTVTGGHNVGELSVGIHREDRFSLGAVPSSPLDGAEDEGSGVEPAAPPGPSPVEVVSTLAARLEEKRKEREALEALKKELGATEVELPDLEMGDYP